MRNEFLTNFTSKTFLDEICEALRSCKSFCFSVSFVKMSGLKALDGEIEAALARGAEGRVITSTYKNFTDVASLQRFLSLQKKYPSFFCRLDKQSFRDRFGNVRGYHSKGYIFSFEDETEVVVGSSNLTHFALRQNIEWDLSVREGADGEVFRDAMREFDDKWAVAERLSEEIIDEYERELGYAIERWDMDFGTAGEKVRPNRMQQSALKELSRYRAMGERSALVVAAAGSGKTFLAAFDAKNFDPDRLLYIVHEGSILSKSLETFKRVFGEERSFGTFAGGKREIDRDFLFATNKSMSDNLDLFSPDDFDYLIVDECHHAAASTYRKIMDYFAPSFTLGLTATPERMDQEDVYALFDRNVPYELRLRDAIASDLVVPFRYFGIRDDKISFDLCDRDERAFVGELSSDVHCDFVHREVEKRRPAGKMKALVFCKNIRHCRRMADAMGQYYRCAYLTGRSGVGERIATYQDLQDDDGETEMLFCVDILNEGVDIPGVNMVLFLRPTESSTIFIQQLGRGLRKFEGKEYVTVLDFIGNSYRRSAQIAFALSSLDKSPRSEKEAVKMMVRTNFRSLDLSRYGVQIEIDELSKEEILDSLDGMNLNRAEYVKKDYENFKNYLGLSSYPRHMDYILNDCAPDLLRFINARLSGKRAGSYYGFLKFAGEEIDFSEGEADLLERLSSMLPLVWPYEYETARRVLDGETSLSAIEEDIKESYEYFSEEEFCHALKFADCFSVSGDEISFVSPVSDAKDFTEDLLRYGLERFYAHCPREEKFYLYDSYPMKRVLLRCLMNPEHNQLGTYYLDRDRELLLFVTLEKKMEEEDAKNYRDRFLDEDLFQWESKVNLSADDLEKLNLYCGAHLFIRKTKTQDGATAPFTYLGKGKREGEGEATGENGTYLFRFRLLEKIPEWLQYDLGYKR